MSLMCYFTFGFCAFCECRNSCIDSQWPSLRGRQLCVSSHPFLFPSHLFHIHNLTFYCFQLFKIRNFTLATGQHSKTVWRCFTPRKLCDTNCHHSQLSKNFQYEADNLKAKHYPAFQAFKLLSQQRASLISNKVGPVNCKIHPWTWATICHGVIHLFKQKGSLVKLFLLLQEDS